MESCVKYCKWAIIENNITSIQAGRPALVLQFDNIHYSYYIKLLFTNRPTIKNSDKILSKLLLKMLLKIKYGLKVLLKIR